MAKNHWNPNKIRQDEVQSLVKDARFCLSRIESLADLQSYFLQDIYGDLFNTVEELYTALDIGNLSQDNARRNKEWKKRAK